MVTIRYIRTTEGKQYQFYDVVLNQHAAFTFDKEDFEKHNNMWCRDRYLTYMIKRNFLVECDKKLYDNYYTEPHDRKTKRICFVKTSNKIYRINADYNKDE